MKWSRVIFDGAKTHFVPTRLKQAVIDDLLNRPKEPGLKTVTLAEGGPDRPGWPIQDDIKEIGLSAGGMTFANMPWLRIPLGGVKAAFAADEIDGFYYQLREAKKRHELGEPTYKLHGSLQCIVLMPQQRTALIRRMEARLEEADRAYNQFLAGWKLRHGKPKPIEKYDPLIYWMHKDLGKNYHQFWLAVHMGMDLDLMEDAIEWIHTESTRVLKALIPMMKTRDAVVRGPTESGQNDSFNRCATVEFRSHRDAVAFINELYGFTFPPRFNP